MTLIPCGAINSYPDGPLLSVRRFLPALAIILAFCVHTAMAGTNMRRGHVPSGKLFGMTVPVSDIDKNPDADNVGAPLDILARRYAETGANLTGLKYSWRDSEPNAPNRGQATYIWPDLGKDPFLQIPDLEKMASFDLTAPGWAQAIEAGKIRKIPVQMDRYWDLVEQFITAAARHAREHYGARYFHAPGNEPSLKSCVDHPVYKPEYTSWSNWYMDTARHFYKAVKADSKDNQVIIGALVTGSEGHVGALYGSGAKGHFDVMDIHAYGDEKTHVSMTQIITTHRVMAQHGDGDKKIWLGEGWSCFPLPKQLDGNLSEDVVYHRELADHYWKTIQIGWMNLMMPREGEYDPNWVLGARYFTFCDLIEGRGWRKRAIPHRNDKGEIDYYTVDGYRKGKNELGPFFRPWGLVDVKGTPKGDYLGAIPPYIPDYHFAIRLRGPAQDGTVRAEVAYEAVLLFTNLDSANMHDVRLAVYGRTQGGAKITDKVQFKTHHANRTASVLRKRRNLLGRFQVVFPPDLRGQDVRIFGESHYTYNNRPYYADAWGPVLKVE